MPWYLWTVHEDVDFNRIEKLTKLKASTLEDSKKELGLIIENDFSLGSELLDIEKDYTLTCGILESKLLYVQEEISLAPDILTAKQKYEENVSNELKKYPNIKNWRGF